MEKDSASFESGELKNELDNLERRKNTFYFLEGLGTLLWVLGDVAWVFELGDIYVIAYVAAAAGNLAALLYAVFKLRRVIPVLPVIGYNLWVFMGCMWAFSESTHMKALLFTARGLGVLMLLITIWEFTANRNNKENILNYAKSFRKFRIREEASGLKLNDVFTLPEDVRKLFQWMLKQEEVGLAEIKSFLKQDEASSSKTMAFLIERGFIKEIKTGKKITYGIRLAPWKGRTIPLKLWEALGEHTGKSEKGNSG